jgi:KUP system potassium uptake protein
MRNLKHNRVLHRTNIFRAGTTDNVPHVKEADRSLVEDLGDGCYAVTVRHGFMEIPDVPALLSRVQNQISGWTYDVGDASFILARDTILATGEIKVMSLWREKLFAFLGRNAAQAAEYYSLPPNRVVKFSPLVTMSAIGNAVSPKPGPRIYRMEQ